MRIAGVIEESIVDGPGIRIVIFFQGCLHQCLGCHNAETWSVTGGREVDFDYVKTIIDNNPFTDGITLSGGEPLLQTQASAKIAAYAKSKNLNVILYTGYLFEDVLKRAEKDQYLKSLLWNLDFIIDGPFILEQRQLALKYKGSANQRIIDVKASLLHKITVVITE